MLCTVCLSVWLLHVWATPRLVTPPTSDRRIYDGSSLDGGRQGLEVMHRDFARKREERAAKHFLFSFYRRKRRTLEDAGGH